MNIARTAEVQTPFLVFYPTPFIKRSKGEKGMTTRNLSTHLLHLI